jgi:rSAM/selenodomain-associated transferase 2
MTNTPSVSIIIPTLNEAVGIAQLLEYLRALPDLQKHTEIIVVDGGSKDATREIVRKFNVKLMQTSPGRSHQMNYGAQKATSDTLFFLHADSYPPKSFSRDIYQARKKGYPAACYRLKFDNPHPILSFYAYFTRFEALMFRFGDQGLLINRALFQEIGGFNEAYLVMEDNDIIKRIRKYWKSAEAFDKSRIISFGESNSNINHNTNSETPSTNAIANSVTRSAQAISNSETPSAHAIANSDPTRIPSMYVDTVQKPLLIMRGEMQTSARRYLDNGIVKLQIVFSAIYLLHNLGIPHFELKNFFKTWISGRPVV